jgi:5'-3' exonuclease
MPDDAPRPTLVLDSPSLLYRAFFALPATIRDRDGHPVNAVRGYLDMVAHLIRSRLPRTVVHTFDNDWRPAFRVAAYPGYKAARRPDPPELPPQLDLLHEVLRAAGLPVADAEGYEADDVIGTLAAAATDAEPIEIVTGDRDLLQLVRDPAVAVLFTVKGVKDLRRFDEAEVERGHGVPPRLYADLATLRGDSSDGLPGIAGVGPKTAATLLTRHGSLDALRAATDLTPRIAEALRAQSGYLDAMRTVVPVARDVAVRISEQRPPDHATLQRLAAERALKGSVDRLEAAMALIGQGGTPPQ